MTEARRVLVIDDSAALLAQAQARLTREGFEVVTTTSTVGIAPLLRGVDLVLIDFHMPGRDGSEVLHALRAAATATSSTAAFFLHTVDKNEAANYEKYGFDGVITLKGDADALARQVNSAFRLRKIRRASAK